MCGARMPRARVAETGLPLIYVHQVGGQDELVFDGASFALDSDRRADLRQLPSWREAVETMDWTASDANVPAGPAQARRCRRRPTAWNRSGWR